jgi:hypothetical protein
MSRDELKLRRGEYAAIAWIQMEDLPTAAHRDLLARRRREIERELRILEGGAPWPRRSVDYVGGWAVSVDGRGSETQPPAEVVAAFPDLTTV